MNLLVHRSMVALVPSGLHTPHFHSISDFLGSAAHVYCQSEVPGTSLVFGALRMFQSPMVWNEPTIFKCKSSGSQWRVIMVQKAKRVKVMSVLLLQNVKGPVTFDLGFCHVNCRLPQVFESKTQKSS